jgi:DNA sulfur modification protein DndE
MSSSQDIKHSPVSATMVESIRISKSAREQLITLKRRTGIENWNVLCRWALCASLAEPMQPREMGTSVEGGIEMAWRTFAGENDLVYAALIRERCRLDGLPEDSATFSKVLRLHLHRGIAYLVGSPKLKDITGLLEMGARVGDGANNH